MKFVFNRPYNMQKLIAKNRNIENERIGDLGFKIAPNA